MQAKQTDVDKTVPRVYRVDERTRQIIDFFCVALAGLFAGATTLYLTGILKFRGSVSGLLWMDLIMGVIIIFLASGYNKCAILFEDSIEVAGWFHSRKLKFSEIRGRQTTGSSRPPFGYAYILVPTDPRKRKLVLPVYLHTNQFFRDWIKGIPKIPR